MFSKHTTGSGSVEEGLHREDRKTHTPNTHTDMYAGSLTRCFANIVSTVMLIEQTEVKI